MARTTEVERSKLPSASSCTTSAFSPRTRQTARGEPPAQWRAAVAPAGRDLRRSGCPALVECDHVPLSEASVNLSQSPFSGDSPCLAVLWVRGVHGSRFIATCQAWPGLLVGSVGVSTWWCGPGCSGARARREGGEAECGVDVPVE